MRPGGAGREAVKSEGGKIDARGPAERKVGDKFSADGAKTKAMAGKSRGDDQSADR